MNDLIVQSVNEEAFCRKAPATEGLLKMSIGSAFVIFVLIFAIWIFGWAYF